MVKKDELQDINALNTQQLATQYAQQQTANANNDTQALLNQYENIANQQKQALQTQQQLTNSQINAQRDDVMDVYNNNARQAYINSMLGKKSAEQQLSQAGLNTSGLVGSTYANIENAYGNTLAGLQKSRDKSIKDINKQLNEAQMQYAIQENQLLANIENAKLELQKYGNQLAYQKYQDALNNYLNFANYDYQKTRDQVADDRYNDQLAYQKERDAVADTQWQQQYDYNKAINDRNYQYQLDRDTIADNQWQQQYDYNKAVNDRNYNYQVDRDRIADSQWQQQYNYNQWINDRNYNYQVNRDNISDSQWQKEYELALKKANSSASSSSSSSSRSSSSSSNTGNYSISNSSNSSFVNDTTKVVNDYIDIINSPNMSESAKTQARNGLNRIGSMLEEANKKGLISDQEANALANKWRNYI